jgi:hypothetical protein
MSLRGACPPVSTLACLFAEPGSRVPAGVVSAIRYRDPTRLPRIQSTAGGPAIETRSSEPTIRRTHQSRARLPPFGVLRAVAPLREVNDDRPRPGLSPSCRSAMCSSWGLAAFLGRTAWMLRIRFYNRRFAHEHPSRKHPLRRPFAERRGKPAGAPLRDPPRAGPDKPSFVGDAGPPRGHPASDGCALDGTPPASDRAAVAPALARGAERSRQLVRLRRGSPLVPSDASLRLETVARERYCLQSQITPPRAARQCKPASADRGAFHRGSPDRAPSRAPAWSAAPAGRRGRLLHVFIDVRKLRLDHRTAALTGLFWPRALPRLLQNRCFNEHCPGPPEHPAIGGPWSGRLPLVIDRRLSIGNRRRCSGSGAEVHRASALPPGIAPGRDFAPTPIASDTSCRGHCLSPCPEQARETDEAAGAARASKARAAGGPCDA